MATSSNLQGLHQVFVYGSLLADEVVRVLLKRVPQSSPATLNGLYYLDGSQKLQAHAYVWANSSDPNLYGDWIFEEWRQAQMKDFIKMTMRFMEELEQPESKARVETYESFYQPSG